MRLEVRAGTLKSVPLAGCRFVRPLGVIRRRQHKLGAAALHFLELLREAGDHDGAAQSQGNGKAPFSNGKPALPEGSADHDARHSPQAGSLRPPATNTIHAASALSSI